MTTTHKSLHQIIAASVLAILLLPLTLQAHSTTAPEVSPEEALEKLIAGNARFIKGLSLEKHYIADRPELAKGQHPYAIILTCADSRLSPEAIFDESLGQLFVVRVAGNVSDPVILGSIEYAAEHLHASLLVVMGHESCGAVKAAVANSPVPPNIAKIVQRLRPAVEKARVYGRDENEIVDAAIKENVRYQVKMMTFESDVLSEMEHEHKLKIVGGVYNLHSGQVEFLSERDNEEAPMVKSEKQPATAKPVIKAQHSGMPTTTGVKSALVPTHSEKKAVNTPAPAPVKKAPAPKEASHSTHDDDEAMAYQPQLYANVARTEVAFADLPFTNKVRAAYDSSYQVVLKRNALMRDSYDRCVSEDCRSLPAGEVVTLDSPYLLNVMGRPALRVRHGKQTFYVPAEEKNFEFSTEMQETKSSLMGQVLSAPTKLMNAFTMAGKR
ncbi:MAG: carbonic anhydrase [Acidobacteria bacterium]|nr:carbonic anhydrase [Acidobacteriota bacterium]